MSEQAAAHKSGVRHLGWILLIGLVAVAGALGAAGWITGYLKPKPKIAIVTSTPGSYWDMVISGAQDAAKARNVDLIVVRSQPDEKVQSQHVRDLLAQGVQGIAISASNPSAQTDLLNEAASKTVLVTFDSDAIVPGRKGFVGSDNYAAGQVAGDEVRKAIPDGGEVIISVGSVDMSNGRDRREGVIDDLLDRTSKVHPPDPIDAALKGDRYSIVATVIDGGDAARAAAGVADALKAHPNVKCVVGLNGYSAPAAVAAIQQVGKTGQIKVIGFDETDATQAGVAGGSIFSSVVQDEYNCGEATVDLIADSLSGVHGNAPVGTSFMCLSLHVMNADNLKTLRSEKLVHTPT